MLWPFFANAELNVPGVQTEGGGKGKILARAKREALCARVSRSTRVNPTPFPQRVCQRGYIPENLSNDDGNGSERVTIKTSSRFFERVRDYSNSL